MRYFYLLSGNKLSCLLFSLSSLQQTFFRVIYLVFAFVFIFQRKLLSFFRHYGFMTKYYLVTWKAGTASIPENWSWVIGSVLTWCLGTAPELQSQTEQTTRWNSGTVFGDFAVFMSTAWRRANNLDNRLHYSMAIHRGVGEGFARKRYPSGEWNLFMIMRI